MQFSPRGLDPSPEELPLHAPQVDYFYVFILFFYSFRKIVFGHVSCQNKPEEHATEAPPGWDPDPWVRTASCCPFPSCDAAVLIARAWRARLDALWCAAARASHEQRAPERDFARRETFQRESERELERGKRTVRAAEKKQAARSPRSPKKRAERAGPRSREHSGRLPERPRRRPRRAPKSGSLRGPSANAMVRLRQRAPVLQPPLQLPPGSFAG